MAESSNSNDIMGRVFFNKFKVVKKIGQGSFGQVYQGYNINNNELVALKFELKSENNNLLETEAYRLIYLKGEGIPKVLCYGNNKKFNILVLQLLGKSLDQIYNISGKKLSLKTTCILGIQMLERIKFVHENYHIHRDIKPDNFVMGLEEDENKVYIIDFGLAKKYKSQSKGTHIPFKTNKNMTGTARYCSINTHLGYEQSRRDDLESIGYVLLYFLRGILPWQGLKLKPDEDQYKKICDKKQQISFRELCSGYPSEFVEYLKYCTDLKFEDNPDYEYLINLLKRMLKNYCENSEPDFDWNKSLKSNKIDFGILAKYKTKSMIMNNKSTNSQIFNKDETAISPNFYRSNGNSIFNKLEEDENNNYSNDDNLVEDNEIQNVLEQNYNQNTNREKNRSNSKKQTKLITLPSNKEINDDFNKKVIILPENIRIKTTNLQNEKNNYYISEENVYNNKLTEEKKINRTKTEKNNTTPVKKADNKNSKDYKDNKEHKENHVKSIDKNINLKKTNNSELLKKKNSNSSCNCLVF